MSKQHECAIGYHWRRNTDKIEDILSKEFTAKHEVTSLEKTWMVVILWLERFSLCQTLKWLCNPSLTRRMRKRERRDDRLARRGFVDSYSLVALLVVSVILWARCPNWGWAALVVYLMVETLVITLKVQFVSCYQPENQPKSPNRSTVLLLVSYAIVILAFAVLYSLLGCIHYSNAAGGVVERDIVTKPLQLAYFSTMTIATVGYGDMTPHGAGYWLCCTEVAIGILMVVVLLARFVGLPVSRREGE